MRTGRIPMSYEEYNQLPFHLGWKNEYLDGEAWITPRHAVAIVRTPLAERPVTVPAGCRLEPVTPDDASALIRTFLLAFRETPDFWRCGRAQFERAARQSIETYFSGQRGVPHPAARLAVPVKGRRLILGAALIVRASDAPMLESLMVRPRCRRQGLATALAQSAANALLAGGEVCLESGYDLANDASAAWHRRFGFTELPDLLNARLYMRQAEHELRRREAMGDLSEEERCQLRQELAGREATVRKLEQVAQEQGWAAVSPLLRRDERSR